MVYSPEEKKRIEKLMSAFSEYIRNSESTDILFSEKLGFLILCPDNGKGHGTFSIVQDYDELLNKLFRVVALDFIMQKVDGKELVSRTRTVLQPILNSLGEDKEHCLVAMEQFLTIEE